MLRKKLWNITTQRSNYRRLTQMFSCEFCDFFKNNLFIEHLRWLFLYRRDYSQKIYSKPRQREQNNDVDWSVQYTVLEFQFRSVKSAVVTKLCKDFEQLFIPITVCRCKQLLRKVLKHIYTVNTYSNRTINQLIIILLKNSLIKIWSKISKIRLIHEWFILAM